MGEVVAHWIFSRLAPQVNDQALQLDLSFRVLVRCSPRKGKAGKRGQRTFRRTGKGIRVLFGKCADHFSSLGVSFFPWADCNPPAAEVTYFLSTFPPISHLPGESYATPVPHLPRRCGSQARRPLSFRPGSGWRG